MVVDTHTQTNRIIRPDFGTNCSYRIGEDTRPVFCGTTIFIFSPVRSRGQERRIQVAHVCAEFDAVKSSFFGSKHGGQSFLLDFKNLFCSNFLRSRHRAAARYEQSVRQPWCSHADWFRAGGSSWSTFCWDTHGAKTWEDLRKNRRPVR